MKRLKIKYATKNDLADFFNNKYYRLKPENPITLQLDPNTMIKYFESFKSIEYGYYKDNNTYYGHKSNE